MNIGRSPKHFPGHASNENTLPLFQSKPRDNRRPNSLASLLSITST